MSNVENIKGEIRKLNAQELMDLRNWILELDPALMPKLQALRDRLPPAKTSSAALIRELRDKARY